MLNFVLFAQGPLHWMNYHMRTHTIHKPSQPSFNTSRTGGRSRRRPDALRRTPANQPLPSGLPAATITTTPWLWRAPPSGCSNTSSLAFPSSTPSTATRTLRNPATATPPVGSARERLRTSSAPTTSSPNAAAARSSTSGSSYSDRWCRS